jgi:hypothetical protein
MTVKNRESRSIISLGGSSSFGVLKQFDPVFGGGILVASPEQLTEHTYRP